MLLAKSVRLEADIRRHQKTLDHTGAIIKSDRGTPIPNPLLAVVDSLQRQQLALIRSLSLNQQARDPRSLNAAGLAGQRIARALDDDFDDLIPR